MIHLSWHCARGHLRYALFVCRSKTPPRRNTVQLCIDMRSELWMFCFRYLDACAHLQVWSCSAAESDAISVWLISSDGQLVERGTGPRGSFSRYLPFVCLPHTVAQQVAARGPLCSTFNPRFLPFCSLVYAPVGVGIDKPTLWAATARNILVSVHCSTHAFCRTLARTKLIGGHCPSDRNF